ncbi:hypothetical protein LSM04_006555 [Trypanosoma melophagium]|uniref:uncharacterized protein n=1 Tax=Trypanosoma melophagium TaxID=715481 RepID=UPI00351A97F4|nr:hypothetical protein LSM04_006555 [Trypanosoma melophagium]
MPHYGMDDTIIPTEDDSPILAERIDIKAGTRKNVNPLSLDYLREKCKSKNKTKHPASHASGHPDVQNKFPFSERTEPTVIPFSDNLPEVGRKNGLPGFLREERVNPIHEGRKVSFDRKLYRGLLRFLWVRKGRRLDYAKEDEDDSAEEVAFKEFTFRYDARAIFSGVIYEREWGKVEIVTVVFGVICTGIRPLLFFLCRRSVLSYLASLLLIVDAVLILVFLLNAPFGSANKDLQYLHVFTLSPLHFIFNWWVVSGLFLAFVELLIAFTSLHYHYIRFNYNVFAVIFPALTAAHAIAVFQRVKFIREQFKLPMQSQTRCKDAKNALFQQQYEEEEEKHRWSGLIPPYITDVAMAMC